MLQMGENIMHVNFFSENVTTQKGTHVNSDCTSRI